MPQLKITPTFAFDSWFYDNEMAHERLASGFIAGGIPLHRESYLISWQRYLWPLGGRAEALFFRALTFKGAVFVPVLWLEDSDRAYHLKISLCDSATGYFQIQAGCRTWQTFDEAFDHYHPELYFSTEADDTDEQSRRGTGHEFDRKRMLLRLRKAQRLVSLLKKNLRFSHV